MPLHWFEWTLPNTYKMVLRCARLSPRYPLARLGAVWSVVVAVAVAVAVEAVPLRARLAVPLVPVPGGTPWAPMRRSTHWVSTR